MLCGKKCTFLKYCESCLPNSKQKDDIPGQSLPKPPSSKSIFYWSTIIEAGIAGFPMQWLKYQGNNHRDLGSNSDVHGIFSYNFH